MILLQNLDTAATAVSQSAQMEKQTVIDLILSSGGTGVTIVVILLILSIVSISIFVERFLSVGKAMTYEAGFVNGLKSSLTSGNVAEARRLCQTVNSPISRMLDKGISRLGSEPALIEGAMEATGKLEITKLEKNLGYLSLIAKLAPMFGFVGTIMGVIKIFYDIAMTDNLSIGVISGGLYQKMITSAAGLMVGIIAFLGYYLVNMRIDKVVERMEQATLDFMDLLFEPSK
ncbi:MAG TPA: MotA/TolQ/ExbB proton channel family protein [Catalimonadaceae bacterium]|nr:MotA/TolQ/ExbB proton channel family protein [Catalimonadaceae bacterium]HPI11590.1 MotA/TolQ/ExbB proton channel family protein [Catalimonadaceae bacterium]